VTEPKPKLVSVGSSQHTNESQPASPQRRRWTDLGVGFWLLAVLLIVTVAIIAMQRRELDRLSTQVETLATELDAANGALQGYENRTHTRPSLASTRAASRLRGTFARLSARLNPLVRIAAAGSGGQRCEFALNAPPSPQFLPSAADRISGP